MVEALEGCSKRRHESDNCWIDGDAGHMVLVCIWPLSPAGGLILNLVGALMVLQGLMQYSVQGI